MIGLYLHQGPEKPLCGTVKVKPGLLWRPRDVGNNRDVEYFLRGAAEREWNQPKGENYVVVNKAEKG